jgi:hypothetical protein
VSTFYFKWAQYQSSSGNSIIYWNLSRSMERSYTTALLIIGAHTRSLSFYTNFTLAFKYIKIKVHLSDPIFTHLSVVRLPS